MNGALWDRRIRTVDDEGVLDVAILRHIAAEVAALIVLAEVEEGLAGGIEHCEGLGWARKETAATHCTPSQGRCG